MSKTQLGLGAGAGAMGVVALERLLELGAVGAYLFTLIVLAGLFFGWLSSRASRPL